MKRVIFLVLFSCVLTSGAFAQELKYSRVLTISNSVQTVPAGKVWKITSLTGAMYNTHCVGRPDMLPTPTQWVKAVVASGFEVNGSMVYSQLRYGNNTERFSNNTCTASIACCTDYTFFSQSTDPLVLPMWLPAGSTLRSISSGVFLSVIEFTEVP